MTRRVSGWVDGWQSQLLALTAFEDIVSGHTDAPGWLRWCAAVPLTFLTMSLVQDTVRYVKRRRTQLPPTGPDL